MTTPHPPLLTEAHLVAFMDIGTNSIRLLVVRINPNHTTTVVTQLKHMVRLGEGEFTNQYLQPAPMDRAVQVVREFTRLARSYGVDDILAVATAATREATNQRAFVRLLQREAHIDVRVVSGPEEARLIYLGVSSGIHLGDKQAFFVDIGGGSTEIIIGTQHQHRYLNSLKLGAIRLGNQFLARVHGPVSSDLYNRIKRYVQQHTVHAVRELQEYRIDMAIGSSGTVENLADIAMRLFYKRRLQRDDVLTYAYLKQVTKMLGALSLEERRRVPGLNPDRADIIMAGAAILDTLMEQLGIQELRVSERGLRDGLLVDYLLKQGYAPPPEALSVRERSMLQLGRACHFDEDHGRNVARLACELFRSARQAGLHQLGDWECELLKYAALLHRIGSFLTYNNYQAHTSYLIRNAELLGFDQTEIAIMATTTLYHRKMTPRKDDAEFAALDKRAQHIVRLLCVFVRLAESLERGHAGLVRHAYLSIAEPGQAILTIHAPHDCQVEIWGLQKHLGLFHKVFGVKLLVQVTSPDPEDIAFWEEERLEAPYDLDAASLPAMPPHLS